MRDKYTDSIRVGIVSSIDEENCTARVTFQDRDDIVSRELPIIQSTTLDDKVYYMPVEGERVRCFFDPEAPSWGFIIGSYYDDTRKPPYGDKNKRYIEFKDKTLVEYDKDLHKLTIHIPEGGETSIDVFSESDINIETNGYVNVQVAKDVNIEVAQNVTIDVAENLTVNATQNINISSDANITVKAVGNVDIEADGDINMKATTINLNEG